MKIGPTQCISNRFFPDVQIDVKDRNGNKLSINDKVRIYGCMAKYGYIGYSEGRPYVYFEVEETSVGWRIDGEISKRLELCNHEPKASVFR